jgi:hypothetical protein
MNGRIIAIDPVHPDHPLAPRIVVVRTDLFGEEEGFLILERGFHQIRKVQDCA